MRRNFAFALLAISLSACASPHTASLSAQDVEQFKSGSTAVLVMNVAGDISCDETVIGIHRKGADKNDVFWTLRDRGYATSQPALMSLPPGSYHLSGAACIKEGYYPSQMSAVGFWFGGVDVKAGEVVYLGTLHADILDYKTAMSSGMKTLNRIFLTGRDANETKYLTFAFKDDSADVLERLRVSNPDIAAKLTVRMPPTYITRENFAAALERAYAPNPDGALPTSEQVDARLPGELQRLAADVVAHMRTTPPAK
jgi:hypothetical protein